jgi:hypothetical protein
MELHVTNVVVEGEEMRGFTTGEDLGFCRVATTAEGRGAGFAGGARAF